MIDLPIPPDTISRDDLKAKLDRGTALRLVLLHGSAAFESLHIPGSVFLTSLSDAFTLFDPEDDIVVYSSSAVCPRGWGALSLLRAHGFRNVRHYRGGLADWEAAGYPLLGTLAAARPTHQPVGG